jgi:hypothetical protein
MFDFKEMAARPGCSALELVLDPAYLDDSEWNKAFLQGAVWSLWVANLITEEEHDAIMASRFPKK